jgi:hydrogenase expression/formation protein HypD
MIRYMDEFRSAAAARSLAEEIRSLMPEKKLAFMEICGGHTLTTLKYGLPALLPEGLSLKSGPGCPVCVTPASYIDTALVLAERPNTTIATFGDMLRVPGRLDSLRQARDRGRDIRVCLSPLQALDMALVEPTREVIFLGIGFETTAPTIAMTVIEAAEKDVRNFSVLAALKTMPAAMRALLSSPDVRVDGFICPGHVTAITGSRMYEPIAAAYRIPCVVAGFEPTDMLRAIALLLRQVRSGWKTNTPASPPATGMRRRSKPWPRSSRPLTLSGEAWGAFQGAAWTLPGPTPVSTRLRGFPLNCRRRSNQPDAAAAR